jgi:hypothetical protein
LRRRATTTTTTKKKSPAGFSAQILPYHSAAALGKHLLGTTRSERGWNYNAAPVIIKKYASSS